MLSLGLLLLAENGVPDATFHDIGMVVVSLLVVLLFLERVKKTIWPEKVQIEAKDFVKASEAKEFVKSQEVHDIRARMDTFATKLELQRLEHQITAMATEQKRSAEANATRYENVNKAISDMRVSIEQVRNEIRIVVDAAAKAIFDKLDQIAARKSTGG